MEDFLQLVRKYKMTKEEAKAFKIALLFIELYKKNFPNHRKFTNFNKGDPRKSITFKYARKLLLENKLKDDEYRNYILAQFHLFKKNSTNPLVTETCLIGEKAWRRWLFWKKLYKENTEKPQIINIDHKTEKVLLELENSRKFLQNKSLEKLLESKEIFKLCTLGEISPYYLFHPKIQEWISKNNINLLDEFVIDLEFFRNGITSEILKWNGWN